MKANEQTIDRFNAQELKAMKANNKTSSPSDAEEPKAMYEGWVIYIYTHQGLSAPASLSRSSKT